MAAKDRLMVSRSILCADYAEKNGDIFFPLWDLNAICRLDKKRNTVKVIGMHEGFKYMDTALTGQVIIAGDRCFFAPCNADDILVYDIGNGEMMSIALKESLLNKGELYNGSSRFWSTLKTDNYVYMFGDLFPAIIKIDILTLETCYLTEWLAEIPAVDFAQVRKTSVGYFGIGHANIDDKTYIPSGVGTGVWEIDLPSEEIKYLPLDCTFTGFFSIGVYGEHLVLTSSSIDDGKILLWHRRTKNTKYIQLPVKCLWHNPVTYNEDLYLFPWSANGYILKISGEDYNVESFKRLDILMATDGGLRDSMLSVRATGNKVSFIRVSDHCWFTYDFAEDTLDAQYYEIEDMKFLESCRNEEYDDVFEDIVAQNNIFTEDIMPLDEFIKRI